ncbi:adenylate/guanylate cyclase domain-containing protein [Roseiconus lacunae]|uniref:adenylate/guanylate cyclase domain-containing protein n=1 Tax=Roseiconus lacunae TaxID=2605694 RepID=UPI001E3722D5|nr:adenylate/guanylate cyclase domain-containing protein [Roseiconus lacunae]MCD0462092.1 adenylate/guanylate cyclase domain-containing protein [Roseiconus lacunae]
MQTSLSYPNLESRLLDSFQQGLSDPRPLVERFSAKSATTLSANARADDEVDSAQKVLRPLFGKGSSLAPAIGDHPNFHHLKGTSDNCYCPIVTMFMDIEGSTRLSLLYPLEKVQRIKNAFIQSAIRIVQSFDGHVHRIMGDAVMSFFGGVAEKSEDAIINGVNCAAVLQHFAEHVVRPKLDEIGCDHDFGIRVGLDFGSEEDVLWSAYGYPGVEEVTATSFFVDIASKLQHSAGRNQAMFGGSLLSTIDFPSELVTTKRVVRDGDSVLVPHVEPNHTDRDGKPVNYDQRILKRADYLEHTPIGFTSDLYRRSSVPPIQICASVFAGDKTTFEGIYAAASRCLPKDRNIKFEIQMPYLPMLPYNIKVKVENHGKEAWSKNPTTGDNHESSYEIRTQEEHRGFTHWEHTKYRGLHFVIFEVRTHKGLRFRSRFGVYVE